MNPHLDALLNQQGLGYIICLSDLQYVSLTLGLQEQVKV